MKHRVAAAYTLALMLVATACESREDDGPLSAEDRAAIETLKQKYVSSWLRDDTLGVLGMFTGDGILLPPGQNPVQGAAAIKTYWWPQDGSHTVITSFTLTTDELEGNGSLAFSRGLSNLAWTYSKEGKTQSQSGRNLSLTVYRKTSDGWRIARQMWGPSLP